MYLLRFPKMLLFYSGDEEPIFVDWQLEVLDHFMQGVGEGLVVHISEHVVDPTILEEIFLRNDILSPCGFIICIRKMR